MNGQRLRRAAALLAAAMVAVSCAVALPACTEKDFVDAALTRGGLCRSLGAAVRFEAEFCPWCGERIREVAK